jgi:hypothetical protein
MNNQSIDVPNVHVLGIFAAAAHLINVLNNNESPYDKQYGRFASSPLYELISACDLYQYHPPAHPEYDNLVRKEYERFFPNN